MAAVDYFLKIDGIDGESTRNNKGGEIDILSFSWGVSNVGPNAGSGAGGAGAGKVVMQDFHFVHHVDKASPKLMRAACQGQHIKWATLSISPSADFLSADRESPSRGDVLMLKFYDLIVSNVRPGANSATDEAALEAVSIRFHKITTSYLGSDGKEVTGSSR